LFIEFISMINHRFGFFLSLNVSQPLELNGGASVPQQEPQQQPPARLGLVARQRGIARVHARPSSRASGRASTAASRVGGGDGGQGQENGGRPVGPYGETSKPCHARTRTGTLCKKRIRLDKNHCHLHGN
jgi:hypothetical protein